MTGTHVTYIPPADTPTYTARTNPTLMVDPLELRGIPALGPGVAGVSPGTQPERETINRLSKTRKSPP